MTGSVTRYLPPPGNQDALSHCDVSSTTRDVVSVVSDRAEWIAGAVEACANHDVVPQQVSWSAPVTVRQSAVAVLLDITPPFAGKEATLLSLAEHAWQPICIASVAPKSGAELIAAVAKPLGYQVLYTSAHGGYWERLGSHLERVISRQAWLVPRVAQALACTDPRVVRALAVAVALPPSRTTVQHWAAQLGLGRQRLNESFATLGLPHPGTILSWLRLARVIDHVSHVDNRVTRRDLARTFAYGNADYLGKRTKSITGLAFGELATGGVEKLFYLMQQRIPRTAGQSRRCYIQVDGLFRTT